MTLTDTGPLFALFDRGQREAHARCLTELVRLSPPLVTPWPCYAEAMYLLHRTLGYPGQEALWRMHADGRLRVHQSSLAEMDRMRELMARYRDRPMDLADASVVAAAEALGVNKVFTLDSDFYIYRLTDGSVLEVVS